jgi:hypothetical protein
MSTTWKRSKKNLGFKVRARREGALARLETQLKAGKKSDKDLLIPLNDKDKERISKEIVILQNKLTGK